MKVLTVRAGLDTAAERIFGEGFAIVGAYEGEEPQLVPGQSPDIRCQVRAEGFAGKAGQTMSHFDAVNSHPVLLVGLGARATFGLDSLRRALIVAFREVRRAKASAVTVSIQLDGTGITPREYGQAVAEYAGLIDYVINHYKTKKGGHQPEVRLATLKVVAEAREIGQVKLGLKEGVRIAGAVNLARDLSNLPAGSLTPRKLAEKAKQVAKGARGSIECKVMDRKALKSLGAGAILAVSQGSKEPPVLVELTYTPPGGSGVVLGLVGKSITFDSGGLDLKNADGMRWMKRDMSGGAAVLAAMQAIAKLRLPVSVKAFMACTENMPSGSAYKPGDVIHTLSGLSVEVDNTDAEGRLTLADAIEYAKRRGVTHIVDLATLTGAIRQFGADVGAGVFGNQPEFTGLVLESGAKAGELMAELPMWEELRSFNRSDMADLKNSGGDAGAGATTAAWFLREFAGEEIPWVHLDIAGCSFRTRELGPDPKGCTGFGVRTLIQLARCLCQPDSVPDCQSAI